MRKLTEGEYQSFLKDNNDLATACVALKRIMRAPDASGFTLSVIAEKALQAIQVTQDCPGLQQAQKTDSVDAASTIQPDDTGVMAEGVRCDTGVNDARPSASVPSVSSKDYNAGVYAAWSVCEAEAKRYMEAPVCLEHAVAASGCAKRIQELYRADTTQTATHAVREKAAFKYIADCGHPDVQSPTGATLFNGFLAGTYWATETAPTDNAKAEIWDLRQQLAAAERRLADTASADTSLAEKILKNAVAGLNGMEQIPCEAPNCDPEVNAPCRPCCVEMALNNIKFLAQDLVAATTRPISQLKTDNSEKKS